MNSRAPKWNNSLKKPCLLIKNDGIVITLQLIEINTKRDNERILGNTDTGTTLVFSDNAKAKDTFTMVNPAKGYGNIFIYDKAHEGLTEQDFNYLMKHMDIVTLVTKKSTIAEAVYVDIRKG